MTITKTTIRAAGARFAAVAAVFGALAAAPALHAQYPISCSNLTMNGTYMLSATGSIMTPTGVVPFTAVGKVTYFGDGTGSSTFTTSSVGGVISRASAPVPATYTVKPDCTGTKVFGGTQHYDFVISPNGRVITFIVTDAGVVLSGQAVRLDDRD
jgi:hypothetical protein